MNRSELQNHLVQQIIDGMDMKTLVGLCYDYLMGSYDKYSDNELTEEVAEYYPELLECDSSGTGTRGVAIPPDSCHTTFVERETPQCVRSKPR